MKVYNLLDNTFLRQVNGLLQRETIKLDRGLKPSSLDCETRIDQSESWV